MADAPLKMCLVGDCKVGKSTLLSKWTHGPASLEFPSSKDYEPTLCPEFTSKKMGGREIQVWDMGFDNKTFAECSGAYVRDADVLIFVFDWTSPETFDGVKYYFEMFAPILHGCAYIVVGNKWEAEHSQSVIKPQVEQFCQQYNLRCVNTNASEGTNVDLVFLTALEAARGGSSGFTGMQMG